MSLPVRVAVFGSCLTRDVFSRRFSPNYKDIFDCVLLSNQSSLVSQMSPPVDIAGADFSGLDERAHPDVIADLTRSFLQEVVRLQPDYLLVDLFGDIHFGCSVLEGGVVTRNRWKTKKTAFYQQTWQRDLPPGSREYRELWDDAAERFVAYVRAHCPDTKIVLHAALNATSYRTADGEVVPFPSLERLEKMNRRWRRLNKAFGARSDAVIDVFTDDTVSFEQHPWGKLSVHYELTYHAAFLSKLTALALSDAQADAESARQPRRPLLRRLRQPHRFRAATSSGSR